MSKKHLFSLITILTILTTLTSPVLAAPLPQDEPPEPPALPEGAGLDYSGGPDGYGYFYVDSLEPGGPVFNWIEIAPSGTNLNLSDASEANITLPFSFTYYGASSTALRVGNNGAVLFGVTTGDVPDPNSCPMSGSTTNNLFGPWWDDWASTGEVYWQVFGSEPNRYVVIEWSNMAHYSAGGSDYATFEMILTEGSTDIIYQYYDTDVTGTAQDNGLSGTVGQRSTSAANTLQYRTCNSDQLSAYLAIRYFLAIAPGFNNSTKIAPPVVATGEEFTYVVNVTNSGNADATNATMTDPIPAAVDFVANSLACSSGTCTYDPGSDTVSWAGGLPAGSTAVITFTVDTDNTACGTDIVNTAVLSDTSLIGGPVIIQATTKAAYAEILLPFAGQNFEALRFPAPGWGTTVLTDPGNDPAWSRETSGLSPTINPHGGQAMAKFNSYNASSGASARLFTTAYDFSAKTVPYLSFWMSHNNSTTNDRLQLQVSTDLGATWTNLGPEIPRHDPACTTACWKQHTQDLSAYAGQPSVMLGFVGLSAYGYNIFIDDVELFTPCPSVGILPEQGAFVCPGNTVSYPLAAVNATNAGDTLDLSVTNNAWTTLVSPTSLDLAANSAGAVTAEVHVPWDSLTGDTDSAIVGIQGQTSGLTSQVELRTTVPLLGSSWTDLASNPHGLRQSGVVYYNGKLYVLGGYNGSAQAYVDIYDIATNTWSLGAPVPVATSWWDCVEIGGKIYCAAGYAAAAALDLRIYDIATNTWATGASVSANRYSYAGVAAGGKYYVIGGYTGSVYANTIWAYDPATDTWDTTLPNLTTGRRYHMAGVIGNKIYVVGGYSGSYLATMEVFDTTTNTWAPGTSLPVPWLNAADGVIADRYLLLSGGGSVSASAQTNQAWVYDSVTDTWSALTSLPRVLYAAEGDSDGSDFWMFGGYSGTSYIGNLTSLDICTSCTPVSGASFTVNPASPRPGAAATFTGAVAGGTPAISYAWDFGDGTTGVGESVAHTYALADTYTVVMTATNCDGANTAVATQEVIVMAGPLAVISPASLEATQCPDTVTTQAIEICNAGDADLTWTLTETIGVLDSAPAGVESLSGSFVVFDPTAGGNTSYQPGVPGTFCFRAESYTTDWEYRYQTWLKFPPDWTVSDAYLVGTPACDSGASWLPFSWSWETSSYELVIDHAADNEEIDHCVATYCVDAIPGASAGTALISWYWDGDEYGNPPHNPCSSDVYTPASMPGEPCDEWANPQAAIPLLDPTPVQWLGENPAAGTVAAGQCSTVDVSFDSFGLESGAYLATIAVNTNDILNPEVNLPVTLTVPGAPQDASFTYTPGEPIIGQEVTFNGSASGLLPLEYTWDFGDGTTGSGPSAAHVYATYGTYEVTMQAAQCAETAVVTSTVNVEPCYSLLDEHFEGAFPPENWSVINNGGTCVWQRNDAFATPRPNYAGGLGFCADADSDKCGGSTTMDTELRTMALDLSGVHTATLQFFTAYNDIGTGGDFADVDVSVNGGLTWANLLHWDEDHQPNGPGELVTLDLTPFAGYSNVLLRYHYYLATYDWWWEVDQVNVTGCFVPGAVPDISVAPASLEAEQYPDTTSSQVIQICNTDQAPLIWSVSETTPGLKVSQVSAPYGPAIPPASQAVELKIEAVGGPSVETNPPVVEAPVNLVLDDGSRDNDIGIGGTLEMLWANRFTPAAFEFPFTLNQVQIYFSALGLVNVGDDLKIVVYENTSGNPDPAVGATFLASFPATVQALDAWNVYDLATPVVLNGPGDVIIGVIGLEIPGTSYWPGSIDLTTTQQRSWIGWWTASPPPDPPLLPPPNWTLIDAYYPGNWMLRGSGSNDLSDVAWLAETPLSGVVPGNACADMEVTFDSTALAVGDYFANLRVTSNDPDEPQLTVPVTLTVIPNLYPNITVTPPALSAAQCADTVTGQTVQICNTGEADLTVELSEGGAAGVAWADDFDSYATGSSLHGQGGWKGWGNDPAATAYTSDVQAISAPNSVAVATTSDLVHEYSGFTAGLVTYSTWQYIPSATTGETYFILLNQYSDSGTNNWSLQVNFNTAAGQVQNEGLSGGTLPILFDQWVEIRVEIDLDNNLQRFYYGGALLFQGTWTEELSGGGILNLAAVDLFANGATVVYYDDFAITAVGEDTPWLTETPTSTTVIPGACADIAVTFDSTGLVPGDYTTSLIVASNDPDTPVITLPVDLTVLEPVSGAGFTFTPPDPGVGVGVSFTGTVASGAEPLTWAWDFGDGTTGSGQNVTHAYAATGDYLVTLTVSNACGEATAQHIVTVSAPDIAVTAPPLDVTLCPEATTEITATISNLGNAPLDWIISSNRSWMYAEVSNGTLDPGASVDVRIIFLSTGMPPGYDTGWLMFISNDPDEPTISLPASLLVLEPAAGAGFSWSPLDPIVGEMVTFSGTIESGAEPLTWEWDFGDGATASGQNAAHAFAAAGDYLVTLTVGNDCGQVVIQHTVTVSEECEPPEAEFTYAPADPVTGETVVFTSTATGTGPLTYAWDFGDGMTGTGEVVEHAFATAGTYTVTLTVSNGCGQVVVQHTVTVAAGCEPVTGAGFTWAPELPISGESVFFTGTHVGGTQPITYTWDFGDGGSAIGSLPIHTFYIPGAYTVTLTVANACSEEIVTQVVTVVEACDPPDGVEFTWLPLEPYLDDPVLFEATVLSGTEPLAYAWDFGDGAIGTGISVTHTYRAAGQFTVTLAVQNGCGAEDATHILTVSEPPPPAPDIVVDPTAITVTLGVSQTTDRLVTIGNTGAADLDFLIQNPAFWLSTSVTEGLVIPGGALGITFTFDTAGMAPGVYADTLVAVFSNDPDENPVMIDLTLIVTAPPRFHIYLPLLLRAYPQP